jgi:hypothetical protein
MAEVTEERIQYLVAERWRAGSWIWEGKGSRPWFWTHLLPFRHTSPQGGFKVNFFHGKIQIIYFPSWESLPEYSRGSRCLAWGGSQKSITQKNKWKNISTSLFCISRHYLFSQTFEVTGTITENEPMGGATVVLIVRILFSSPLA